MTEAFATVDMPVASKKIASLQCKVDKTGAGGNMMPLWAFSKTLPNQLMKTGMLTGLQKCNTKLRAYNRTNIPQLGALDTPGTTQEACSTHQSIQGKGKSQTGYEEPQANQLQRWSNQGLPRSIWYLPHISQRGCYTSCAHTLEMPNSHKTAGRQEAGQTLGARSASDITNYCHESISLLMESRQWPKDMPKDTSEQSYQMGPLQDTNTRRNHPWASW